MDRIKIVACRRNERRFFGRVIVGKAVFASLGSRVEWLVDMHR
jgi:hypothetical protein